MEKGKLVDFHDNLHQMFDDVLSEAMEDGRDIDLGLRTIQTA